MIVISVVPLWRSVRFCEFNLPVFYFLPPFSLFIQPSLQTRNLKICNLARAEFTLNDTS